MSKTLRFAVSLCLVFAMIITFIACADNKGNDTTTTADNGETTYETPVFGEGDDVDNLPELNYKGAEVSIFHRGGSGFDEEFENSQDATDLVDVAVYKRNRTVEKRLNVTLKYTGLPWSDGTYNNTIYTAAHSGDNEFDIFSGPSYHIPILMVDGCYSDLSKTDYLDFDKVWWANGINDGMAIDGKVFVATGDISLGYVKYLHCLIFNEMLYHDVYSEDSLYETVSKGDWTVEKMAEVTNGVWEDLDKDGLNSEGDRFGYVIPNSNLMRAYIDAVNLNIIHVDSDGNAAVWEENQSHVHDAIETLNAYFGTEDVLYTQDNSNEKSYNIFKDGRAIFVLGRLTDISSTYRDIKDFTFGVIPLPKWDDSQEDYAVTICGSESVFAICSSLPADEVERASAVMQALAIESYKSVTPVYYENALKIKYDMGGDKAKMLDFIRGGATFNPNIQFNKMITNGDLSDPKACTDYSVTWSILHNPVWISTFDAQKGAWNDALTKLSEAIADIET